MALPVILKPRLRSQWNHWFHHGVKKSSRSRDLVIALLSLIIMSFTYSATKEVLNQALRSEIIPFRISDVLNIFLFLILSMLLFSNIVVALTSFFLSRELPQLIAAPLKPLSFFNGKLLHITSSSSWIAIVFSLPLICAIGRSYNADVRFYTLALILAPAFFLIPANISAALALIGARILSVERLRFFCLIAGLSLIIVLYGSADTLSEKELLVNEGSFIINLVKKPVFNELPSSWIASTLASILENKTPLPLLPILYLYAFTVGSYLIALLLFKSLYYAGFNKSISSQDRKTITSTRAQKIVYTLTPFLSPQTRALLIKEFKTFCRDIAQSLQFIILLGLCLMYLINLKRVDISPLQDANFIWSQCLLVFVHTGMAGFILCALCTRFVYTSISLEGQRYWIIAKAPLDIERFLKIKFFVWWIPIASIGSIVYVSGALALYTDVYIIIAQLLFSLALSYGLVGLALGFGSFFVFFDWDHVAQLSTNVGSILYMLTSCILLLITMIPSSILLVMYTLKSHFELQFSGNSWNVFLILTLLLIWYINYCTTRWCLKQGSKSLKQLA